MKRIIEFFTRETMLVNFIVVLVSCFGFYSMYSVQREIMPQSESGRMNISVAYPGASAEDVELNVIVPIEEIVREINGIDEYTSVSMQDRGLVMVTLDEDVHDIDSVKDEIYRKVSRNTIRDLPDEVETVTVSEMNVKLIPVYKFSLSIKEGSNATEQELYQTAELLDELLTRQKGISQVDRSGYREREIQIDVDPRTMQNDYIALDEIVSAIKKRNVRSTGGTFRSVAREETVLTIGQFQNPDDVRRVIVRSGFDSPDIKVSDLARVVDDFEEETSRILVDGKRGVVLTVRKRENADIIDTVETVKRFLEENKPLYQDRFNVELVDDNSASVRSLINVVVNNAVIGFVIVFIILLIFLDLKTSFWTAFGIPVCLFVMLIYMKVSGLSMNMISLGAFITVLGMLVDDAIVIAENIYEKRRRGMSPVEAAVAGVSEVAGPVLVTVLTTVVAFLPLLAIKGMMGRFIAVYPVIVTVTLLASLFEAFFLLPNHLANGRQAARLRENQWFDRMKERYGSWLQGALNWRYVVICLFILLLGFSVIISRSTISSFRLFWDNSAEEITVDLEGPTGITIEGMEKITVAVEKCVRETVPHEALVSVFTTISGSGNFRHLDRSTPNFATLSVKLVPVTDRDQSTAELIVTLRKAIKESGVEGLKRADIRESSHGPQPGSAVDVKIVGNDNDKRRQAAEEIAAYLATLNGVKDTDTDDKAGKDEVVLDFDYAKMARRGLTVSAVAETVRTAIEGNRSTYVQSADDKLYFRVRLDPARASDRAVLQNLLISNTSGKLVRLGDIATMRVRPGTSTLKHYNGVRATTLTANVDEDIITSRQANMKVRQKFADFSARYPGMYLVYAGAERETNTAMSGVMFAFIMALMLIYFMLAFLFRSLTQPFVVISVIPFGMIGVLLAFTAHSMPMSFMGLIGMIGLSGIVVNDSIIMVSFINSVLKSGEGNVVEAIVAGAKERLRPILMTTVTTVGGLLPTVYGIGGSADSIKPTVMALAYGLLFATLITLLLIPCVFLIFNDCRKLLAQMPVVGRLVKE